MADILKLYKVATKAAYDSIKVKSVNNLYFVEKYDNGPALFKGEKRYTVSKEELDNILKGYSKTGHKHNPADINVNSSNRFVTDTEKSKWNAAYAAKSELNALVSKAQSTADDAKSAIDGLEIGGRNYLLDGDFSLNLWARKPNFDEEMGFYYQKQTYGWNVQSTQTIPKGTYILSGWFKRDDGATHRVILAGGVGVNWYLDVDRQPANEWFYHSQKFTISNDWSGKMYLLTDSQGKYVYFAKLKLERGNKPTDWTPAPEDTEAQISKSKEEAEATAKKYADAQDALLKTQQEAYADGIVTDTEKSKWNTASTNATKAVGWGDHSTKGYLTSHQSLTAYLKTADAETKYQPKGSYASASHSHAWSAITSKPSTFTPSTHTHAPADITQNATNRFTTDAEKTKWNTASTNATKAVGWGDHSTKGYLTSHQSLTAYLKTADADTKYQPKGSYASASHSHAWSAITSKPSTFAPSSHNHTPTEITQNTTNRFVTDAEKAKWNLTDTIVRSIKMKDSTEPLITAKNEIIIPTIAGPKGATGPAGRGVKWTSMFGVPVTTDSTAINGTIKPDGIDTGEIKAEGIYTDGFSANFIATDSISATDYGTADSYIKLLAPIKAADSVVTITAAAFYEMSDKRLKENIKLISKGDINLYEFNFKSDKDKNKHYGVIAQEVEEIYPELVSTDDKDIKSVNYIELLVLENVKLREENEAIKKRLDKIEALLNK